MFYLRKLEISEDSEFSILALILKSETRKTRKFCVKLVFFYFRKLEISKVRSSHRKCYVKKVFLKGFTNFIVKHQENTRPQECNFIKKENPTQVFSLEI